MNNAFTSMNNWRIHCKSGKMERREGRALGHRKRTKIWTYNELAPKGKIFQIVER